MTIFTKPIPDPNEFPATGETPTPYLDARREWNERYGSYIAAAETWKNYALGSLVFAGALLASTIYLALRTQYVPYVVEVDGQGRVHGTEVLSPSSPQDQTVVKAALAAWVGDLRSVVADPIVQRQYINKVYAFLYQGSPATKTIGDWYRDNNPYQRILDQRITVEVESVLQQSENTWQIDWIEIPTQATGEEMPTIHYRGLFTIEFLTIKSTTTIPINPLGISVKESSISKIGVKS
jgi:type IV secretion system protein VirB5